MHRQHHWRVTRLTAVDESLERSDGSQTQDILTEIALIKQARHINKGHFYAHAIDF
jgi:hypothetical protein